MKKALIGFCFAIVAVSAQANYLWWQVSNTDTGGSEGAIAQYATSLGLTSDQVFGRVVQVSVDESGKETRITESAIDQPFTDPWYYGRTSVDMSVFGESASSYSYYVEFVNATGDTVIGRNSEATAYEALASSMSATLEDIPSVSAVWHGGSGSIKAAPEPTSAMLMLLGVAGLALKRKQKKA